MVSPNALLLIDYVHMPLQSFRFPHNFSDCNIICDLVSLFFLFSLPTIHCARLPDSVSMNYFFLYQHAMCLLVEALYVGHVALRYFCVVLYFPTI